MRPRSISSRSMSYITQNLQAHTLIPTVTDRNGPHGTSMTSNSISSASAHPPAPTHRLLHRISKTPLGSPENQLCIGDTTVALHDNVLIIENSATTHMSEFQSNTLQVLLGTQDILIDMWKHSAYSVSIGASPEDIELARAFFLDRGIAVYRK